VTPILHLGEVPAHPHISGRGSVVEDAGVFRPGPAPRFSRTPSELPPEQGYDGALDGWGLDEAELERLRKARTVGPGLV
jgi:alpha-methylacyl-CoA racemase